MLSDQDFNMENRTNNEGLLCDIGSNWSKAIVEVLLGLAYELFNVECSTEPSSIAEYMQDTEFGIALFQHNIDTPDGTHSTWRK